MIKYAFAALAIGLILHRIGLMWIFGIIKAFFWLGFMGLEFFETVIRWVSAL